MTDAPADPFAFFRQMVTQWEKVANDYGTKLSATPEFAQGMAGATAVSMQVQQATNEAMARALAAANMPSRADIDAVIARLTAIEAQLARIETGLGAPPAATSAPRPSAPKPKRTKKPPTPA
jgi:3-methyladenine DNA glycosylase/8-oxoguanine DNA glycosylase